MKKIKKNIKYLLYCFAVVVIGIVIYLINNSLFIITGTWYCDDGIYLLKYNLKKDGTYKVYNLYDESTDDGKYIVNKQDKKFTLKLNKKFSNRVEVETTKFKIKDYSRNVMIICETDNKDECLAFYRNEKDAKPYDYTCLKPNVGDFCIEDDTILAYTGTKKTVKIPSNIRVIASNSFSGDYGRGVNLQKITIPGTVETIEDSAFMFSNVDEIYIEEGVKYIGAYAFADTCVHVLDFPKSIEKIDRGNIVDSEEMCGTKLTVYLYKDSVADKYFQNRTPYYDDFEIIYKD